MFYELWFDGGISAPGKGNPYGSYELDVNTKPQGIIRWEDHSIVVTSNEAEYIALQKAISYFVENYELLGSGDIILYGDCELVRNQVGLFRRGGWIDVYKCNFSHLIGYRNNIRTILEGISKTEYRIKYKHVPRKKIVERFGH